uniref:Uncharacterized protein n=1 Tax=Anopheles coluzzii TaxID=1518534 RepID=A0A8W7PD53_ANOCL
MAITPLADTANRLTAESVRMVVSAERMLRSSHTFTERSSDPETTLSSRVNTVEVTFLSSSEECPFLAGTSQFTAACHIWAVASPLPVNTMSRVGWNLIELTDPLWP